MLYRARIVLESCSYRNCNRPITLTHAVRCHAEDCWVATYHSGAEGGQRHYGPGGVVGCQQACVINPACTAVDYATFDSACYLHGPWSGYHLQFMTGVSHYDYKCRGQRNNEILYCEFLA